MRVIDFMNMTNGEYHDKAIEYNMTGLMAEIKRMFPNDLNPNLSDPKYKDLVKELPFAPVIAGGLATTLGLKDEFLTLDLWKDISNGYCPAEVLPADSPFHSQVIDTPRGRMLKLMKQASPMDELGTYRADKAAKDRRIGTEFLFGLGENTSNALTALAIADPTVEKRFAEIAKRIFTDVIVPQMELDSYVRKGKDGTEIDYASELLVVIHQHIENRGTETSGPEPFRHFHVGVMNMALREDSEEIMSLMNDLICKNKENYTALFQKELKPALEREFGLSFKPIYLDEDLQNEYLEDSERNITSWDVEDKFLPQSLRESLGSRRKEMEEFMRANGHSGQLAMEIARKESREEKTELSPSELKADWAKWYAEHGFSAESMKQHLNFEQTYAEEPELPDPKVLFNNFIRKHKEVAFSESQWSAHCVKQLLGICSGDRALRYAAEAFENECLLVMTPEKYEYYQDFIEGRVVDPHEYKQKQIRYGRDVLFTTKTIKAMEDYAIESSKARQHETQFSFDKNEVTSAIMRFEAKKTKEFGKAFKFAKGQKEAAIACLTESGSIISVAGRAGSGKSTLLQVVVEEYKARGFQVFGTSTSDQATKELANSTGMKQNEFMNSAELFLKLSKDKVKLTSKTVIICDEAGMADTETFYKLVKASNEAGAKLILCGESQQLQSIGAGGLYRTFNERFVTKAVTEINRQRESRDRDMVEDFACGRAEKAIDSLHRNGNLVIKKTNQGRLAQLVQDYTSDPSEYKDKFIVAATNMDVDSVNDAVRAELKKTGKLEGEEVRIEGKDGIFRSYCVGDRIIFTKKQTTDNAENTSQKISNSQTGSVIGITHFESSGKPSALHVQLDDGTKHFLNVKKKLNFKHGYASTVHKSQGSTRESVFYWVSPTLNNLHSAYVACSRHKGKLLMYLSEDMVEKMAGKMEGKKPTVSMVKAAQKIAMKQGLELAPEILNSFIDTRAFLNDHTYKLEGSGATASHVLDQFKQIAKAMSTTNFKLSTFDFAVLDGKAKDAYNDVKSYFKVRTDKALAKIRAPEVAPSQIEQVHQVKQAQQVQQVPHVPQVPIELLRTSIEEVRTVGSLSFTPKETKPLHIEIDKPTAPRKVKKLNRSVSM